MASPTETAWSQAARAWARRTGERGERNHSGLELSARPPRAVGNDGDVAPAPHRRHERAPRLTAAARRGAAHAVETEPGQIARHDLPVPGATHEHRRGPGAVARAEPLVDPRHHEDLTVPHGIDDGP